MTHPDDPDAPTLAVAHGNRALARHLRQSLEVLRERSDNHDFRQLVDNVLAGRTNLRDAYTTPTFAAGINFHVEQFAQRYEQLSPEQRADLTDQGRQRLDEENRRINLDG
ncbi:hypothetical protein [Actinoplanes sp. URMC 104]|uniref:hypothetical protein n=1 Tax=Actinoplanes sp. URMC 104 TaxID=3423409 RepID=UPI003F1B02D6